MCSSPNCGGKKTNVLNNVAPAYNNNKGAYQGVCDMNATLIVPYGDYLSVTNNTCQDLMWSVEGKVAERTQGSTNISTWESGTYQITIKIPNPIETKIIPFNKQ